MPAKHKKAETKKTGNVSKIIQSPIPDEPEKAEIVVHEADDLYKEVRIENKLEDEAGRKVKLKSGAAVDVTIEADKKDTIPQSE